MSNSGNKALTSVVTGLVVSLGGGAAGYIYRDSFDAPRLSIQYARIEAPRRPIKLSIDAFRALKIDGNVMSFIADRVPWEVRPVIRKNEYTYQQIGEMRELLRTLMAEFRGIEVEEMSDLDTMERALRQGKALLGKTPPSELRNRNIALSLLRDFPQLSRRLAATRNYFRNQWNTDIFEVFYDDPLKALRRFITETEGDLTQTRETIKTISSVAADLDQAWTDGLPKYLSPVGDKVPEVKISVVISNTGRTDALLRNVGSLSIGETNIHLIRFDSKAERRRRSHEFDKIEAGGTLELDLAFDKENNSPEAEGKIYDEIAKGTTGFKLTLADIAGNNIEKIIGQ